MTSRLITKNDEPIKFTSNRETDARTALTRGLKEYLETIETIAQGGRLFKFKKVFDNWAEPEITSDYPSALIYADGPGTYDSSSFTPNISSKRRLSLPDGRYIVIPSEYVLDLTLEAWATDPKEREGLAFMLEDALSPVDFMFGMKLELPHYYNVFAQYELLDSSYEDSQDEAQRRIRRVVLHLRGRVPVIRLSSFPGAIPKPRVEEVGPDVILDVE